MFDIDTLRQWWEIFVGDGNVVEIRILGRYQYSGYFKSLDNLIGTIQPFANMDDEQCYFTLNQVNEACYGRQQCEKFVKSPKATTTDNDIVSRKFILIDFDPKRATGVNSTDDEFELAHKKAQSVFSYLRKCGFSEPIICKSGNGWHLIYKVDLPNDQETTEIIKRFLQSLGIMFTDEKVDIDEKVFNLGRICKLYGTMAKKGANLQDRPWRMSEIIYVPSELKTTPIDLFKQIADLVPQEQPQQQYNGTYRQERFDLDAFLTQHGVQFQKMAISGGNKYILDHCFFDESHKGKDAVLFQYDSGAIQYVCLHNSCKNHTWHDVRLLLDPHAYDKKPRQFVQRQQQYQPKQKYQIKEELPELGNKWLCMSDIKKVDLSQIENVKTGFRELDGKLVGLHMSEITILSGSNASGKSSWLNSLLLNIVQQHYKIALWSGELRADILKTWIQMVAAGKENLMPSKINEGKYYVPNAVAERIDQWLDGNFFIYNNEYGTKWEQIFHDMNELLKVGVKVFALDNLFTLDIDLFDGDKNNKQKELILQIKDFAKKNQVHIILVAHPRKVMTFLRKNDISGTSDVTNAADNVFIMHRVNEDFLHAIREFFGAHAATQYESFGNVLAVEKNRMYGVADLMCGLFYEQESRRFKNYDGEIIMYDWNNVYSQSQIEYQQIEPMSQQIPSNFEFIQSEKAPF